MKKLTTIPHELKVHKTVDETMVSLENVYNYKRGSKIPLKFLAEETAKIRSATGIKKQA